MQVRVRNAASADADELAILHIAAWQAAYAGIMPAEFLNSLSDHLDKRKERWRATLARERSRIWTLVADDVTDGRLLGFATFGQSRDDDAPSTTAELWAINLAPDVWRQGVGSTLLDAVVQALQLAGFAQATLWVLEDNTRARRFYEHHGWTPDGSTKCDDLAGIALRVVRYVQEL